MKEFGAIGAAIESAIRSYAEEVSSGQFPGPEHGYAMKDEPPAPTAPSKKPGKGT